MQCKKCGTIADADSKFCKNCGEKLEKINISLNKEINPDYDAEPTVCLDEDELEKAFLEKYPSAPSAAELSENEEITEEKTDFADEGNDAVLSDIIEDVNKNFDAEATMVLGDINENFMSENTILLDETDDNLASDIISDGRDNFPLLDNEEFFANNEAVQNYDEGVSEEKPKSFNDNSDTITFAAIEDDDYIPFPEPLPPPPEEEHFQYREPPARQPKKASKKSGKIGFMRVFAAVLLSVVTIAFVFAFSLTLSLKLGLSGNIIRNNICNFDGRTLFSAQYDGDELSNTLYNSLGFGSAADGMATQSSFRNYMLRTDFLSYSGRTADSYLRYIIDGVGNDPSITSADFVHDFIMANNRASIEQFEYKMTEQDYLFMQTNLENDNFDASMSISEWSSSLGFSLGNLKYLFSYFTIIVFFIIAFIMFIWTALALKGRTSVYTGFFSVILKISGSLMILLSAVVLLGSAVAFSFTNHVMYYIISHSLITFALISLCIGFAEFILGMIFKTIKKCTQKNNS